VEGDPHAVVPAIQRAVEAIDPDQPIMHVQTFDEMVSRQMAGRRFNMLLLGGLAALAVALALVGVYGVVAHAAAQRSREIGIRIALGAQRRDVIALAAGAGLRWALGGIAIGLAGALVATRVMASLLYGVTATDVLTFTAATLLTLAVVLVASYLPARRAGSVNPISALRQE
jgi:ABC-type antimicrobial peptide transport system permease subunit